MADSTLWNILAETFTRLAPARGLYLEWQYTSGKPGSYSYRLRSGDLEHDGARLNFARLARKAGAALNESGDKDSLEVWYTELRVHDRDPRNKGDVIGPEVSDDGTKVFHLTARIPNVCEASASRCMELERIEWEAERRPVGQEDRSRVRIGTGMELRTTRPDAEGAGTEDGPGDLLEERFSRIARNQAKEPSPVGLSKRDAEVHDIVGKENFCNLTNADIIRDLGIKKRLSEFNLKPGTDATKACLDRIRRQTGYPLSREITKKRSHQK